MAGNNRPESLQDLLTRETLLEMAGDTCFARGEEYARRGRVHDLTVEENGLTAGVSGTEEYNVELWVEHGRLQFICSCPLGVDDIFCEHCVAVGLTWLAQPNQAQTQPRKRPAQKPVTMKDVQHFLDQQDRSTLVQWILDRAERDETWQQQLLLKVASQRSQGIDILFRLDRQEEFWTLIARLRQTYKAKRNFMALLKQRNW